MLPVTVVGRAAALALLAAASRPTPAAPTPDPAPAPVSATAVPPSDDASSWDPAREWTEPPAGSPEDRELYRAGLEATKAVTLSRLEARKLQWRAREWSYESRLEGLGEAGGPSSKLAVELLARYRDVVPRHYVTLIRQWPVDPTRGCSYQVMHLGGVMGSDGPRKAKQLAVVREELEECVEKAQRASLVMTDLNARMQALLAEADGLLPPVAPAAARAPTTKP
jgi:hypothetical protein